MKSWSKILTFSKVMPFVVLLVYLLNLAFNGAFDYYLALNPILVISQFQAWRIISFPFASGALESIILFFVVFYFVSPKLEFYLNKFLYPILLFLIAALQGIVLTLAFWQQNVVIAGMEGIAFFVLTLQTLLRPKDNVFPMFNLKTWTFALFCLGAWALYKVSGTIENGFYSVLPAIASGIFGIGSGLITYFQVSYMQKIINKRRIKNQETLINIPKPEELKLAMISAAQLQKAYSQYNDEYDILSDNPSENEERLNEILEKIFNLGKDSLTKEEKTFLDKYSKQL